MDRLLRRGDHSIQAYIRFEDPRKKPENKKKSLSCERLFFL